MNRPRNLQRLALSMAAVALALVAAAAQAAIPSAERQALLDLYASTNGSHWNTSTNWNGAAGTECTWSGVACDSSQSTVQSIALVGNNLSGVLPGDLANLTNLVAFQVSSNALAGAIPSLAGLTKLNLFNVSNNALTGAIPALVGLTSLAAFSASNNKLTGSIPSLAGLTKLGVFDVSTNALTGSIPSLAGLASLSSFSVKQNQLSGSLPALDGLTNLIYFYAGHNQLSGTISPPAGLTNLSIFDVGNNQLTGAIPEFTGLNGLLFLNVNNNQLTGAVPALAGLPNLSDFYADNNQLTGTIPALTGLTSLRFYSVGSNQLSGPIPDLTGLTGLTYFAASHNRLTGAIPSLAGLSGLTYLYLRDNQLSGAIPSLTGLANLSIFDAGMNQLTGSIPALADLSNLNRFSVDSNQLTGDVPPVPSLNALVAGGSDLCPNNLNAAADSAWDAATGQTPWYTLCIASTPNYQGLWWKADEPGWGMNFAHAGDQIFATWYTYDIAGKTWWLSMLAQRISPAGNSYGGALLATTGPPFNAVPFPPVTAAPVQVGTGTLTFADGNDATFAYSVNGVSQSKGITRFDLGTGPQPTCTYGTTTPNFAAATNYQDLWWVANGAESGWGVNFAHQGNSIFATWYTYDVNNSPLWLSVLAAWNGTAYAGTLYRSAGPTFSNYNSSQWVATPVGAATIAFADGNHATFGYTTNGQGGLPAASQSKQITRFPFASSGGTVCH